MCVFGCVGVCVKARCKELKIFNILRAYELKFKPNLGCRAYRILKISDKFLLNESKILIFHIFIFSLFFQRGAK